MKKSNSLVYKTSKVVKGEDISVAVKLNDECKNGVQYFSITGFIYKAGKPKDDENFISGGCIHSDIKKHFPELAEFIPLHLADLNGVPMYAVTNGYYHLKNGFVNIKTDSKDFAAKFCECYRIKPDQLNGLLNAKDNIDFAFKLAGLKIPDQWKKEAQSAIAKLEKLTGLEFVPDSEKTHFK